MPVRNASDAEQAVNAFAAERNGCLLLTGNTAPAIVGLIRRLALQHRLPLVHLDGPVAEGVLMSHGPDGPMGPLLREAAGYVDRILRGAKSNDLPVQYLTEFEPTVNLKSAKTIGLTIPEGLRGFRANEVN